MDFTAFQYSIVSSALRNVAAHWNKARGARTIPAWADIKPSAISAQLRIVWSYKYDPATKIFTGRLAGEQITTILGRGFRGLLMTAAHSEEDFPCVYALCNRVVTEPSLYRSDGTVFKHPDRYGIGERIMLPLSDGGEICDGILGATEYQVVPVDAPTNKNATRVIEQWFSLS